MRGVVEEVGGCDFAVDFAVVDALEWAGEGGVMGGGGMVSHFELVGVVDVERGGWWVGFGFGEDEEAHGRWGAFIGGEWGGR